MKLKPLLLTLLFLISLSVNAGWFLDGDKQNKDSKPRSSVDTTISINGGFGLRLGAAYNQDFIKPFFIIPSNISIGIINPQYIYAFILTMFLKSFRGKPSGS